MQVLALVLMMNDMLPVSGRDPARWEAAQRYRLELAQAIVLVTDELGYQVAMVKIARYESNLREDVGRCQTNGAAGDRGPFQVVPRSDAEKAQVCRSLHDSARLGFQRVLESVGACAHLPARHRLAVYARGRCDSGEGRRLSEHRWPRRSEVEQYERALTPRKVDVDGAAESGSGAAAAAR